MPSCITGVREVIAGRLPRLIALFKLLKAAVLIAVGVGALKLLPKDQLQSSIGSNCLG